MRKNVLLIAVALFSVGLLSGCASLKGNVPFQYQPSLISNTERINKSVGFNIVKDGRSQQDIKSNEKTLKDVPNKVTYKMMEDFKSSGIFEEVNFPSQESDDIIINGTLNRFSWKVNTNWFSVIFFPLVYLGLPLETHVGDVDISLEIVDKESGKVLGNIQGSGSESSTYSLYNYPVGEFGSELAEAFRESVKQLKEKMLSEINF